VISLIELQGRPPVTGCEENTKNTAVHARTKACMELSYLSSLLKDSRILKSQQIPSKTSDKPVNRTLSLKGSPLQTGYN
jgi:hypothetical protein